MFYDSREENQMLFDRFVDFSNMEWEISIIDGDLWKQTLLTSCLFIAKSALVTVLRYSRN